MNFEVQGQPTFVSQKHLYLFTMQINRCRLQNQASIMYILYNKRHGNMPCFYSVYKGIAT